MKKIGLLIPTLNSGGAERVMAITSKLLSDENNEVYFFLFVMDDISYDYEGKMIDLKSPVGKNTFQKVYRRLTRIIKLSYYKHKYDLDLVISFLHSANVVNYYSLGKAEKIISSRSYFEHINHGKQYAKMIPKIKKIIVQTERMKLDFENNFKSDSSKIEVINNPFNLCQIEKLSTENIDHKIEEFIREHRVICTVGSFKKNKGYWHLLKSFKLVKEQVENAGLLFIGHNGELEERIKQMAMDSGYGDDILFLGYEKNPFKYISKCEVYVSCSLYEGFPNSIVEAMACGLPVISSDCLTGPREILTIYSGNETINYGNQKYGILTKEFDENIDYDFSNISNEEIMLSEYIISLLTEKNLNMHYREMSKKRATEFSQENYMDKLRTIIYEA